MKPSRSQSPMDNGGNISIILTYSSQQKTENRLTFYLNQNLTTMTEDESHDVIKEVKAVSDKLGKYSEQAKLDSFLSCYDNSPYFLHFSADGVMRNYEGFKNICSEYYLALEHQTLSTITEKFNVLDTDLVITGWSGNIIAHMKNGDIMNMYHYSISNLFKKLNGQWRIIHSHESSLPPEIIKK